MQGFFNYYCLLNILYMPSPINANLLRQLTFYAILVVLCLLLFQQLFPFLPAFLGAITFYMLMRSSMNKLVYQRKWEKGWSAALLLLLSFLIVLLPIGLLTSMLYNKVGYAIQNSTQVLAAFNSVVDGIEKKYNFELLSDESIKNASASLAKSLPALLGATFNSLSAIVIMYFVLYFMLINSKEMEAWLNEYIPLKDENVASLGNEMKTLVISNALGIPLTALVQGVVALLAYWALGVNDMLFWFVITCIASMFPLVGAALAYVPVAILLFAANHETKGVIMLLYGFGVISTVDSIFRFALQKKMGDVHPLITVFGVIVGLNLFGFIGLIFGPILISLFILLIKIYINEFVEKRRKAEEELTL
jgi:predicted PurR-regulated permease PerM